MKISIVGGGIVGLAIARSLILKGYKNVTIIEKDNDIANHQSSRNSGVMHAGLYYKPGSLKAILSRDGIVKMKNYCTENNIKWEECGKIVVANKDFQKERLKNLFERGKKNSLKNIEILNQKAINKIEPYVNALSGIYVPEESIVNYKKVAKSFAKEVVSYGGIIHTNTSIKTYKSDTRTNNYILYSDDGRSFESDIVISSAGLYSDKVALNLGVDINQMQTIPFRGEYYILKPEYKYLVNNLIYPLPDPNLPFLGVHFTKLINGEIEAGPNAVLALAREGYDWKIVNLHEFWESLTYPGLWKFIAKYPSITAGEILRSLIKPVFVESLKKLIPDIRSEMLVKGNAGIRAQLMNANGTLEDDFCIKKSGNIISILNAPSPAATSSIAIADYLIESLGL